MSKFKLGDVAEIQSGPFGTQLHKEEYVESGIPMLNSKNIGNGNILTDSLDYVPLIVCERLPRYILHEGDILFGRAGTIERHTYVSDEYDGCFQGTNCIRIRCKDSKKALYISYYLWLKELKQRIENSAGGSIQSYITTDLLKNIYVDIPEDYESKANILKIIDDKIENNHRINDNLQQMAYTKYMHMFYGKKFNGKLDDIIVEQPKSSIQVGEAKEASGTVPFFTSGEAILKWPEALATGRNCFLNTGGNADVKFYVGKSAYSTDTWCISAKNDMADYLYLLLYSIRLELNLKFFQGTGLKHLQKPLLRDRPIYIPSDIELREFNIEVKSWLSMISDNIRESEELISLRDWLLPMLMNGQAVVQD